MERTEHIFICDQCGMEGAKYSGSDPRVVLLYFYKRRYKNKHCGFKLGIHLCVNCIPALIRGCVEPTESVMCAIQEYQEDPYS